MAFSSNCCLSPSSSTCPPWPASASTRACQDKLQPDLCADPIPGRLLVVKLQRNGFRTGRLFLFTTLTQTELYPPLELAGLYAVRWNIELNLRYLKTQMHMEQLECKSAEMAKKEWLAGLLAYNLVRASMLCAALRARVPAPACQNAPSLVLHSPGLNVTCANPFRP